MSSLRARASLRARKARDAAGVYCTTKKRVFLTRAEARTNTARRAGESGVELGFYKCSVCGYYHSTGSIGGTTIPARGRR